MASPSPPTATAAGQAPTASTPAAHAALTSSAPHTPRTPARRRASPTERPGERTALLLLPRDVRVGCHCAHVLYPVPPPVMDAEDGHHTCHSCGQQRQRIECALAHPQRAVTLRKRGGM